MPVSRPSAATPVPGDPRSAITEASFTVAPELIGTPLARPWRRACAMGIDGLLIALLANTPGVLLALASGVVLFRASAPSAEVGYIRRSVRMMFRFSAACILFVAVIVSWGSVSRGTSGVATSLGLISPSAGNHSSKHIDASTAAATASWTSVETVPFLTARNEKQAHASAARMIASLRAEGRADPHIAAFFADFTDDGREWVAAAADSALRTLQVPQAEQASTAVGDPETESSTAEALSAQYADALQRGDTEQADVLRQRLAPLISSGEINALQTEVREKDEQIATLGAQLDRANTSSGIMTFLRRLADDLGLGFGWAGLYFTACVALWNGRTPGKRIMGIRIIRLDGKPVGWWMAFERFGGYAASVATGLLGFFQIMWDRNRQAMHDKISETVVVRG